MKNPTYNEIIKRLEDELSLLKRHNHDFILFIEKAMGLCSKANLDIRKTFIKEGFLEPKDEICFFKHIKPIVISKMIFYTELFYIESYRPKTDKKIQIIYFRDVSQTLCSYLNENKEFYQYYRRKKTFSDHLYFLRGNVDHRIHIDHIPNHIDPDFTTGYDNTLAKIMAYEQLKKYTSNEIEKLNSRVAFNSSAEWTGQNVDAAELIYALVSVGVINNGNIGIKELARLFEKIFNIKLDDIYRIFQDIQGRTTVKTKFLDNLKEALLRRLDDMDK